MQVTKSKSMILATILLPALGLTVLCADDTSVPDMASGKVLARCAKQGVIVEERKSPMDMSKSITVMSIAMVLLGGCCASPSPKKKSFSDEMTKWGPPLSEEEDARIAKLSTTELVEMLKTGDTLHKFAALSRLEANGGRKKNFDLLLSIAAEKRGPGGMIVEGLVPAIDESASAEDKRRVDKFVDFLETQLKSDEPSVRHTQAVRSLGKAVFDRDPFLPAGPEDIKRKGPPYGYARVMGILTWCLDNTDWRVREEAIRWLGTLGAQDPARGEKVVATLEAQLAKEGASGEEETVKEGRRKVIERDLKRLRKRLRPPAGPYEIYDDMYEH